MPVEKTLSDLSIETLKDIDFAEKQILRTLPKMARAAKSDEGKARLLEHRQRSIRKSQEREQSRIINFDAMKAASGLPGLCVA